MAELSLNDSWERLSVEELKWAEFALDYLRKGRRNIHDDFNDLMNELRETGAREPFSGTRGCGAGVSGCPARARVSHEAAKQSAYVVHVFGCGVLVLGNRLVIALAVAIH